MFVASRARSAHDVVRTIVSWNRSGSTAHGSDPTSVMKARNA